MHEMEQDYYSGDNDLKCEANSSEFLGHKQVFKSLMATGFGKIGDTDSSCWI